MSGHLSVSCTREGDRTFALTIREDTTNKLLGYAEITLVTDRGEIGAQIQGWNADESVVDKEIYVKGEGE